MAVKYDSILGALRQDDSSAAAIPATSVTDETTYGISSAIGVGTNYAREDHTHGSTATPTKTTVGLANVDNTSDASKPVSTAQQTALDLKANLASPTFTGTVSGVTAAMVGAPAGSGTSTGSNTGDQTLPTDATITTTDVTTNDATTTKHGWFPKLPTATGKYLRDDFSWQSVVAAQPDIPLSLLGPSVDETVTAGYSAYVSEYYEIADQKYLELGDGGIFEIG